MTRPLFLKSLPPLCQSFSMSIAPSRTSKIPISTSPHYLSLHILKCIDCPTPNSYDSPDPKSMYSDSFSSIPNCLLLFPAISNLLRPKFYHLNKKKPTSNRSRFEFFTYPALLIPNKTNIVSPTNPEEWLSLITGLSDNRTNSHKKVSQLTR